MNINVAAFTVSEKSSNNNVLVYGIWKSFKNSGRKRIIPAQTVHHGDKL